MGKLKKFLSSNDNEKAILPVKDKTIFEELEDFPKKEVSLKKKFSNCIPFKKNNKSFS